MKAAVYFKPGAPEELCIVDRPEPAPGVDEVLIRVEAIGVESGDILRRRLMDPGPTPEVSGYAAAGTIIEVGKNVRAFAVGERVTSFGMSGAYAELRAVPAATCWRAPDGLDLEIAVTAPVAFGTAAYALSLANVTAEDSVLILGATGGVGLAAVQLAKLVGASVLGTGLTEEGLKPLAGLGLDHGVVPARGPVGEQVRQALGGRGCSVIFDAVGGDALREGLAALDDGGRVVLVGISGPGDKRIDTTEVVLRRLSVFGCFVGFMMGDQPIRGLIDRALAHLAAGKLTMPVAGRFVLSDIVAAHRQAESASNFGRVIVRP